MIQSHSPATQRWLPWHALLPPHVQSPEDEQPSAPIPHAMHASPPMPHAVRVGGVTHVEPEQQPLGHVVGLQPLQVPPEQVPAPHDEQAAPPVPHAAVVSPGMQLEPPQHPVGHEVASHTQLPLAQRWPATHAGPIPQDLPVGLGCLDQAPDVLERDCVVGQDDR